MRKTSTTINPALSRVISETGHTDLIVVTDAGLPIPPGSERIDLAYRPGAPAFLDVLDTVLAELVVEGATVSAEVAEKSPEVLDALREDGVVLALGGGAPMIPDVTAALEGHRVLFLDVGIADAAKRIGFDKSRPLLSVNPRQSWIKTMEARRPTYESLADHRVDTAGRDVEAVVAEALTLLEESA